MVDPLVVATVDLYITRSRTVKIKTPRFVFWSALLCFAHVASCAMLNIDWTPLVVSLSVDRKC